VTALDQLPDTSFDVIVSFETLEHVQAQERMLAGFRRLLRPDAPVADFVAGQAHLQR
jgi:2-polyprenyl-3-methyl-5-hydroxy-6-metoxy-1,4-benzoquinol methylase